MAKRKSGVFDYLKRHRKDADTPYAAGGATLGIFSVVSIIIFGASWFQYIALSTNNFAAVVSAVLVDLANSDRVQNGAGTLAINPRLVEAAQAKADDMATRGYFSHNTPDGREPWNFIKSAGYNYKYAGENLAIQFSDSIEVERAWISSELHRKNILDNRFTEIGIATAYGMYQGQPTTFVVQMFGTPKDSMPPAEAKPIAVASREVISAPSAQTIVLGATYAPPEVLSIATEASFAEHVAASPQTYLRYAYAIMAAIILVLGIFMFSYEVRQRHFRHSIYAIVFCFALLTILYVADATLFTNPIITATG